MYINVHNACNCTVFWWLLLTASLAVDAFCNYIYILETLIDPYHQFSHKFTEQRLCLLSCCLTSTEARWPIRDGKDYVCVYIYVTYVCIHEIWCKMVSCRSH